MSQRHLNPEKVEHHIKHLQELHDNLDKQIIEEELHHGNCATIGILKKKKLKLKDEIQQYQVKLQNEKRL